MITEGDSAGNAVKQFRRRQNPPMRMKELAALVSMTSASLSRIENGKQLISDEKLPKFVAATGLPAKVLRPDLAKLFEAEPAQ